MVRILHNLRITEVSTVDKGAGEGVKILITKRRDDARKELSEMEAVVELAKRAVALGPDGVPGFHREIIYKFMTQMAERDRTAGESEAQAFAKFMKTEDGRVMYHAYKAAKPAPQADNDTDDGDDQNQDEAVVFEPDPDNPGLMRKKPKKKPDSLATMNSQVNHTVETARRQRTAKDGMFDEIGVDNGSDTGRQRTAKALSDMDSAVAEVWKAETKLSREQAVARVAKNPRHAAIWKAYRAAAGFVAR